MYPDEKDGEEWIECLRHSFFFPFSLCARRTSINALHSCANVFINWPLPVGHVIKSVSAREREKNRVKLITRERERERERRMCVCLWGGEFNFHKKNIYSHWHMKVEKVTRQIKKGERREEKWSDCVIGVRVIALHWQAELLVLLNVYSLTWNGTNDLYCFVCLFVVVLLSLSLSLSLSFFSSHSQRAPFVSLRFS